MKKFLTSSKLLISLGGISLVMVLAFSFLGQNFSARQAGLYQLSNGLGVCFQRVNQSFTALMIKDFSSNFMTKDFQSTTGDCFSELANAFSSKSLMTGKIESKLNNIMSDTHWFSEKTNRLVNLSRSGDVNLSQSNVINKYIEIETLKVELEEEIVQRATSLDQGNNLLFVALVLSQLLLCASFFYLFMRQRVGSKDLGKIENEITGKKINERDSHLAVQKIIRKVFNTLEIPNTYAFVSSYHQSVIEENYKLSDHLVKANTLGKMNEERENLELDEAENHFSTIDFNQSISIVLDKMKGKAFNHGIVVDTEIADTFVIKSEGEPLNQLLFSILNFSMDSSLNHNEGRKIEIKGKPLGGIAYCKFKITGFCFNDEDLAVINGKEATEKTNVNLVILRELVADANVKLSVKNKYNSEISSNESEIELIFQRASASESKVTSRVLKGKKSEIKKFLNRNLTM